MIQLVALEAFSPKRGGIISFHGGDPGISNYEEEGNFCMK
jgi:hypothetical protein